MGKVKQTRRKLAQFFNWRVSVTLTDSRVLVGTLMAVDKHVNLVLCNTEEYRKYKVKGKPEGKELKRMLGFIVARGQSVLYVQPEELQSEELVETEKPKKKAAAKAAPAPAAGAPGAPGAPGVPGATGPAPPALAKLGGIPGLPPGLLQTLPGLAGMRPPAGLLGGIPGLGGHPGMPGLPGLPQGLPQGLAQGGLPQINPQLLAALKAGMPLPGMPTMRPGMQLPPRPF